MHAQEILCKRRKCHHGWARIYTIWMDNNYMDREVGLTGNGTQDLSRLGDFMSQPGIYQGWNIG